MLPSDIDTTLLCSEAQELEDSRELRRLLLEDDDDLFRLRRPEAQEASESRRFDLDLPLLLMETIELEVEEASESLRWLPCPLPFNIPISCICCAR